MSDCNLVIKQNIQWHRTEAYFYNCTHPEDFSVFEQRRLRREIKRLVSEIDVSKPVLDLGSGTGHLAGHLRKFGVEAIACDLSPDMLAENPAKTKVLCDATNLPFDDGHFGAVVGYSVFHHFPDPNAVMREVCRVADNRCILFFDHDPFVSGGIMKRHNFTLVDFIGWLFYLTVSPKQVKRLAQYALWGRKRHLANIASLNSSESFERVRVGELVEILEDAGFRVELVGYGGGSYLKAYRGGLL